MKWNVFSLRLKEFRVGEFALLSWGMSLNFLDPYMRHYYQFCDEENQCGENMINFTATTGPNDCFPCLLLEIQAPIPFILLFYFHLELR